MAANTEKNTEIEIVRTDVIETELSADEAKKLDEAEVGAKLEKIGKSRLRLSKRSREVPKT